MGRLVTNLRLVRQHLICRLRLIIPKSRHEDPDVVRDLRGPPDTRVFPPRVGDSETKSSRPLPGLVNVKVEDPLRRLSGRVRTSSVEISTSVPRSNGPRSRGKTTPSATRFPLSLPFTGSPVLPDLHLYPSLCSSPVLRVQRLRGPLVKGPHQVHQRI